MDLKYQINEYSCKTTSIYKCLTLNEPKHILKCIFLITINDLQKLEESLLDFESHEPNSGVAPAPVSTCIRRIITRNLAESPDGRLARQRLQEALWGKSEFLVFAFLVADKAAMEENRQDADSLTVMDCKEQVQECSLTKKVTNGALKLHS